MYLNTYIPTVAMYGVRETCLYGFQDTRLATRTELQRCVRLSERKNDSVRIDFAATVLTLYPLFASTLVRDAFTPWQRSDLPCWHPAGCDFMSASQWLRLPTLREP